MNKKYLKTCIFLFAGIATIYFGYRWNQARELDNYFIHEIYVDSLIQFGKGKLGLEGPTFDEVRKEMKEFGYNPYEMQQIVFKGYKKAIDRKEEYRKAEEFLAICK